EQLGRERIIPRQASSPRPAVYENVDRSIRAHGGVYVEPLDWRGSVRIALGLAQAGASSIAVRRVAPRDLGLVGRVLALVVGVVELDLIEIEPHCGSSGARRLLRGHLCGRSAASRG